MNTPARDQYNVSTPLRCPICGSMLQETMIRSLGTVTNKTTWQMHAGKCPEHGWFQAEVVGRPPRDIFAVHRPFGASRRLIVNGEEHYQFPTVWNDVEFDARMDRVHPADPLDAQYWKARGLE